MTTYLLIRVLLLAALGAIAWGLARPVSTASSLARRRIGIGVLVAAAIGAILVPSLANKVARLVGVDRGVNLIVYALVVALIAQMVTAYRREARMEARLAVLARSLALSHVLCPDSTAPPQDPAGAPQPGTREVECAASGLDSPTSTPDNDMVTNNE